MATVSERAAPLVADPLGENTAALKAGLTDAGREVVDSAQRPGVRALLLKVTTELANPQLVKTVDQSARAALSADSVEREAILENLIDDLTRKVADDVLGELTPGLKKSPVELRGRESRVLENRADISGDGAKKTEAADTTAAATKTKPESTCRSVVRAAAKVVGYTTLFGLSTLATTVGYLYATLSDDDWNRLANTGEL